ncbi:MAG TPA: HlyD family efflux transporter periplasmic adaptor subunit [Candidatus Pullichristensenella excrementigallinarum]|uniref:HlyD family efflux transporter periplasmic adaptor subunit n=1 Tax=Candidatus Pullichristensenella excrementigallinarum TaxID=2840907 RepID=A0A9D1LC90_9FIRM|nr:HlyD family efflux transporter periplasmic adaptor subunit [Candidatus Pullichristensenella excrementigallinarum]
MKRLRGFAALILIGALCLGSASAEMFFNGKVTGAQTVSVSAPFGGVVKEVELRAGDRVSVGQEIATIQTSKVYAAAEGKVSGVFGQEGDSTEGITERYGAVLYIEPMNKYIISASTEKAYNKGENKYIHIGEVVYLSCTADGTHRGTGIVSKIENEGEEKGKYTVEVTGGEFYMGETVNIFRDPGYASSSRIGRGTVAANAVVPIKGEGSILKMHVKNGDFVERGELLFECVSGTLDGLYASDNRIVSDVAGIVSKVDAVNGQSVEKNAPLITVYPDETMQIEISVAEADLPFIQTGMPVEIEFNWNPNSEKRVQGTVTGISYATVTAEGEAQSGDAVYTGYVSFTPDESVRLGMSVLVYTVDDHEEEFSAHEQPISEEELSAQEETDSQG